MKETIGALSGDVKQGCTALSKRAEAHNAFSPCPPPPHIISNYGASSLTFAHPLLYLAGEPPRPPLAHSPEQMLGYDHGAVMEQFHLSKIDMSKNINYASSIIMHAGMEKTQLLCCSEVFLPFMHAHTHDVRV